MMQNYQSDNKTQFYGAPIRQQFGQQLQAVEQPRKNVKLTHAQKDKTFYLTNIENAHHLNINAPGLKYQVSRKTGTNNYSVQYFPKGKEHAVDVKYEGVHVEGSPFLLAPSPPKMIFNHDEELFSIKNIHDVEKLQIKSDTLPYEMFRDKESSTKYHVKYEPGQQIHDVDVIYDESPVDEGSFRLVPKEMKEAYMRDQEQGTLNNKIDQLDLNAPQDGELLWEHTPENVNTRPTAQQNIGRFAAEQPVVMSNSKRMVTAYSDDEEDDEDDLIYEHIPQQQNGRKTQTLYQPPSQSRNGSFY